MTTINVIPPVGSIVPFAGSTVPDGWLLCDGSEKSQSTYADLYSAIGTTYNSGYSSTTSGYFRLPDLRGIFLKGAGTTDRSNNSKDALNNYYAGGSLGTYNTDKMQGHYHTPLGTDLGEKLVCEYCSTRAITGDTGPTEDYRAFHHQESLNTTTGNPAAGSNGTPRTGNTTEPQYLSLNFIIKAFSTIEI